MSLAHRIRSNLPSRKPQLWEHPARALFRRAVLESRSRLTPAWLQRPRFVPLFDGSTRMEIVLQDSIGRAIYLYGVYEISLTRLFQAVLRSGDTVIDVGANRGYYTLLAAKLVGPRGEVHAFEPVEELRRSLERSVALNGFTGVVTHDEAVWERTGQVAFYEGTAQDNSGLSSIMPGSSRSAEPRLVPSTTLDEVAKRTRRIDLVKLDIEGCELPALCGAGSVLGSANPPILVFEATDPMPIAAHLESFGYDVRAVHYSHSRGLEFPFLGQPFDNLYASYEASNFVAVAARCSRALWPRVEPSSK